MNPAGDAKGENNKSVYHALSCLDSSEESVENLHQVIASVIPSWSIYTNCIRLIISHLNLSIHDIALINLLPWRADEPDKLYEASWKKIASRQVDFLMPERIIALGSTTENCIRRYSIGNIPIESVRRSGGDNRVSTETIVDVSNLTQ